MQSKAIQFHRTSRTIRIESNRVESSRIESNHCTVVYWIDWFLFLTTSWVNSIPIFPHLISFHVMSIHHSCIHPIRQFQVQYNNHANQVRSQEVYSTICLWINQSLATSNGGRAQARIGFCIFLEAVRCSSEMSLVDDGWSGGRRLHEKVSFFWDIFVLCGTGNN